MTREHQALGDQLPHDPAPVGPKGAPVELLVARDGAIWLVEDKNGTVLRVGSERYAAPRAPDGCPRW